MWLYRFTCNSGEKGFSLCGFFNWLLPNVTTVVFLAYLLFPFHLTAEV